jgi:hypothetical protein
MRVYRAKRLVSISNELVNLFQPILDSEDEELLPADAQAEVLDALRSMSEEIEVLGLPLTKLSADRFAKSVANLTGAEAYKAFEDLNQRFQDEIEQIQFFYVKPEKLNYFGLPSAFGAEVAKNFPSAEYDIQEAANCFASRRYTATVMHSMRVLEAGLGALASALKVKRSGRGWGSDLNIFSNEWQKQLKGKRRLRGWKQTFFAQAFADFRYFADAWRNHAMHASARYGEEEAARVLNTSAASCSISQLDFTRRSASRQPATS